jgi:hypothetical protein
VSHLHPLSLALYWLPFVVDVEPCGVLISRIDTEAVR